MNSLKLLCATFFLVVTYNGFSQDDTVKQKPPYNRWSLDLGVGLTNPINYYAPGYHANTLNFTHFEFGGRFMANNYFGVKLMGAYDFMKNDAFGNEKNTKKFKSNFMRFDFEGIFNLHQAFHFNTWTKRLGLQLHGGLGYSSLMKGGAQAVKGNQQMVNFVVGLTPMVRLSDKISLNLDVTLVSNIYQECTWDMTQSVLKRGVDGVLANASLSLYIYLGKNQKHADWYYESCAPKKEDHSDLDSLRARLDRMEQGRNDDDKDGVPNYLDREPNTAEGAQVNHLGITVTELPADQTDSDGDGVMDSQDLCPMIPGSKVAKGCPDTDGDEVPDLIDMCPNDKGAKRSNGCPSMYSDESLKDYGIYDVLFETSKYSLRSEYVKILDNAVKYMNENPKANMVLKGYTDERGSSEYNERLSRYRAEACKRYLISKGISAERVTVKPVGERSPKAEGSTAEDYKQNRRVAFSIAK